MKNSTIIIVVIAIITSGAGFFAGMQYQKSKNPSFPGRVGAGQSFNRVGPNAGNGIRQGLRPVSGVISSVDDKSITVKLNDGSSKIIILSENTEINKADTVGKDQLITNTPVMVIGNENSDGSITASNIQLNPRQFVSPTLKP